MPRKIVKAIVPTQIEMQQAKVAEKAAKKARRKMMEENSEDLRIKLTELIREELPQIKKDLSEMSAKDRCDTIAKLAPYVLPKLIQKPVNDGPEEEEKDELKELASRTSDSLAN